MKNVNFWLSRGSVAFGCSWLLLAACSGEFDESSTGEAGEALMLDAPGLAAARLARTEEVAAWNARRRGNERIHSSVVMPSGQTVDFLESNSVYTSASAGATAPAAPTSPTAPSRAGARVSAADSSSMVNARSARTELDELGIAIPKGTIPSYRTTWKAYIDDPRDAVSLDDFINRHVAKPVPQFDGSFRLYGTKFDARNHVSNHAEVSLWRPAQVNNDEMSLMQGASLCSGATPASTMEAIEVGVQRNFGLYGDGNLHFFTYFRTAGVATGNRIGGYNQMVTGFVPNAGATFAPGATVSQVSTVDGAHFSTDFEVQLFQNRWWIFAFGQWIGYYPTQNAADAAGARITFDLMGARACQAQWFGEYFDGSVATPGTNWTNGDMGSGRFAANAQGAWIRAARMGISSITDVSNFAVAAAPAGATPGYDPDCYSMTGLLIDTQGIRFWRVGGPGGSQVGCN